MTTYRIVRMYRLKVNQPEIIRTGLTLEEARTHCRSPETSSTTCLDAEARKHTRVHGPWFDTFEKE